MSTDAFGPIVDNADGVSEMIHNDEASKNLAHLDAVGNSMKAYTKALSMTTGTLTAIAILITYFQIANIHSLSLINPYKCLFIGRR
jgi:K(+)-stimulated pyrophosphate-energized sodium pump